MRSVEFTYFLYFVSPSLVTDEHIFVLQVPSLLFLSPSLAIDEHILALSLILLSPYLVALTPFVLFVFGNTEHLSPFHL